MVINATFNNISVISWRLVLLVQEIRVPRENHRPDTGQWRYHYKIVNIGFVQYHFLFSSR